MIPLKKVFEVSIALVLTIGWIIQALIIRDRVLEGMTWIQSLMVSFAYMTIWTNTLILFTFWSLTLNKDNILTKKNWQHALLVYILVVGIVYHLVIAAYWTPTGKLLYTDKIFHTFSPIAMALYWLVCIPKTFTPYTNCFKWLWYPVLYASVALSLGLTTGKYPYPIFDLNKLSVAEVALNGAMTIVTYVALGFMIIFINNLSAKRYSNSMAY